MYLCKIKYAKKMKFYIKIYIEKKNIWCTVSILFEK